MRFHPLANISRLSRAGNSRFPKVSATVSNKPGSSRALRPTRKRLILKAGAMSLSRDKKVLAGAKLAPLARAFAFHGRAWLSFRDARGGKLKAWRVHYLRRPRIIETALKAGTVEEPHHRA